MKELVEMQLKFKKWLKNKENQANKKEMFLDYDLIERKIIQIAEDYDYRLVYRNDLLGRENIFLVFLNRKNSISIAANANEKGFRQEVLDSID